jgi:xanthine dehydrogenase small subunit
MSAGLAGLELARPEALNEALRLLRDEPSLVPIAGCTDVYVALHFRTLAATRFVDLWPLDELRGIAIRDGALRIGALATYTDIRRSAEVRRHIPMLAAAAAEVGGVQIQNRGTIGGNIANGSPAGDTLPVLAAANAVLLLQDTAGQRRVPFGEFYTGYRSTVLRPGELIVAIEIPPLGGRGWFRKVGTRAAQAISKIVVAGVREEGGAVRFAVGSVAPTVVRLRAVEAALAGGADADAAVAILEREIQPIDDIRSTAAYRRQVTANLLRRFLLESGS